MALQGKGPETKTSTPWLQHQRDHPISPCPCSPPPARTVGDGGHDGLLGPLAGTAHRPHHVPAIAVGADDALPALLPGQALQLLRRHMGGVLSTQDTVGTHTHTRGWSRQPST